jgi:hypothetical protein
MFDFIEDAELRAKVEEEHGTQIKVEVEKQLETVVTSKVDEAVAGLKNKNTELLQEKKEVMKKLKEIGDLDVPAAREALEFLQKDERARLVKEGKIDELLAKETSQLKTDYETRLEELNTQLEESRNESAIHKKKYETKMVEDAIRTAALEAGIRPEALVDVLLRGGSVFSLGDDGSVEARDSQNKLIKNDDDMILNPTNWIDSLKKTSPHYWPPSVGADLTGVDASDKADMQKRMDKAIKDGNMDLYRKLREKSRQAA